MGGTLDGKACHVGTTITVKGCAQGILGDTKLAGNLVHIDFHFATIVGISAEIELHRVFQNQVGVDALTLSLLDGVLTGHLSNLIISQGVRSPEICIVSTTAKNGRSPDDQQCAEDI